MKLYCRIKVNGKWTFRAACLNYVHIDGHVIDCSVCDVNCEGEVME